MNLVEIVFAKFRSFETTEEGLDKCAKYFQKPKNEIRKWHSGTVMPDVFAAQIVLNELIAKGELSLPVKEEEQIGTGVAPSRIGTTIPMDPEEEAPQIKKRTAIEAPAKVEPSPDQKLAAFKNSGRFHMLIPTNRDFRPAAVESIVGNIKASVPREARADMIPMKIISDTVIHHARNMLATAFLDGPAEWSIWMDSDMIAPIGNPKWFAAKTGYKGDEKWAATSALERLTSHQGKLIVAAPYSQRNRTGKAVMSADMDKNASRSEKDALAKYRKSGPFDQVIPVHWVGFGTVAVHRRVFEDILKLEGMDKKDDHGAYGFFTAFEGGPTGEDTAFHKRAKQAGHTSYVDFGLPVGHIGMNVFML